MAAKKSPSRRGFIVTSAATAGAMALPAASYAKVAGANENLRIGFLGVGGRCQQHVDVILEMQAKKLGAVPVAVNDVWDGDPELGNKKGRILELKLVLEDEPKRFIILAVKRRGYRQ